MRAQVNPRCFFFKLARFDKKLVQHTFAYITAAKKGISETELEDVLSLDDRWYFVGFLLYLLQGLVKPVSEPAA